MAKRSRRPIRWSLPSLSAFSVAVVGYLVACLVLGGGTREGFFADVALQVCAVPLLLWSIWRLLDVPPEEGGKRGRVAILACVLIVAFPLVQLMPLPPSIWMSLPGRGDFESNLVAAGLEVGWLPLSLSPRATWLSALALLPPIAVFLGTLLLGYADRRRLSLVLLLIGLLSACLGLLQVAQGSASPLRFYAFTNTSDSVGFFANRNHYSALLYCLILFAAAWAVSVMATVARDGLTLRLLRRTPDLIAVLASFTVLVILIGAQAMARSRAGLGLTIVAMLGALAMAYLTPIGEAERDHHKHRSAAARRSRQLLIGAIAVAALIVVQFALYRIQSRFGLDALSDARLPFARNTIEAAIAYMPFGSGMGTFVSIYPAFEKATDNVVNVYANRAHNDYLEFWLEGGVMALVAMFLFLVWIIGVFLRLWRYGLPGARHRDNLLACAAVLIVIAAVTISFVVNRLGGVARSLPILQAILLAVGLVGVRVFSRIMYERRRRADRRDPVSLPSSSDTVLLVGWSSATELFIRSVAEFGNRSIHIAGILSQHDRHVGRLVQSVRVLGTPDDVREVMADLDVHGIHVGRLVIMTSFDRLSDTARQILLEIESTTDVRLDFFAERLGFDPSAPLSHRRVVERAGPSSDTPGAFEIDSAEIRQVLGRSYWSLKRAIDAIVALVLLIALAPIALVVAFVVALDVGLPILFIQQRPGLRGVRFNLYKFRTMGPSHDLNGHKIPDSQRLSRVGDFLRRTRLDELPQLFNILVGDMSFVGPRPLVSREQSDDVLARLLVRPGLTGWAQVRGGRVVSVADKTALDLWYVRHASLALDFKILAETVPMVLFGERVDRGAVRLAWRDLRAVSVDGAVGQRQRTG